MIIFTGDWHGNYDKAYRKIKTLDLYDCIIVQVGDFGVGFERNKKDLRKLHILNEQLKGRNILLYAIRGNHDDPVYFDGSVHLSNLMLVPDYTVLSVYNKRIFCVGGAISVDRKANPDVQDYTGKMWKGRKEGINYWIDEAFVLKDVPAENIDVVVTHSAPNFCRPYTKSGIAKWIKHDPDLVDLCNKERSEHTVLYENLKLSNNITHWFYGHFHDSNMDIIGETKFVLLNELEFFELK